MMTSKKDDERLIASARAAVGEDVEIIIRICCLRAAKPDDWTVWLDEGMNRLRIRTDQKVRIYPAKKPVETVTTEDLYRKARPQQIAKYSRWGLILHGLDAKSLAFLLGTDDRLRLVYFEQGNWVGNRYPLEAGIRTLCIIAAGCGYSRGQRNRKNRIIDLPDTIARFNFHMTNAFVVSTARDIAEGIANCQRVTTKYRFRDVL